MIDRPLENQHSGQIIEELIAVVGRAEQAGSRGDSDKRPRRFPWADDEEAEILQNEVDALRERYR